MFIAILVKALHKAYGIFAMFAKRLVRWGESKEINRIKEKENLAFSKQHPTPMAHTHKCRPAVNMSIKLAWSNVNFKTSNFTNQTHVIVFLNAEWAFLRHLNTEARVKVLYVWGLKNETWVESTIMSQFLAICSRYTRPWPPLFGASIENSSSEPIRSFRLLKKSEGWSVSITEILWDISYRQDPVWYAFQVRRSVLSFWALSTYFGS